MAESDLEDLLKSIARDSSSSSSSYSSADPFHKDSNDLVRRVSLLSHLFHEISIQGGFHPLPPSWYSDLLLALRAVHRLLLAAPNSPSSEGAGKRITFQFQCVTWKLEKALASIPFEQLDISEEVQEQVDLVRSQLRRAAERYGPLNSKLLSRALSEPLEIDLDPVQYINRTIGTLHIKNIGNIDHEVSGNLTVVEQGDVSKSLNGELNNLLANTSCLSEVRESNMREAEDKERLPTDHEKHSVMKPLEEAKKSDGVLIPEDFLCPISLELMRDPVIVATGQTYERSYIQRWIDSGNVTCPKTQQKLQNFILTPNYVLRSLISQWCTTHNVEQPIVLANGKLKNCDGSLRDISGDIATIEVLVNKLSSQSIEECKAAVSEIRSLSKRSTDNRILIAEAGAIPALVKLLTSDNVVVQENAVTSILNLSIYENNKGLIMLAGAVPSIVQVLRSGSMQARENSAATLFSLSLGDENKIIIGASGAIPALVELLQDGTIRGKKDAATALFNLCIYQGNKGRAVRAGIIVALLKMLTESSHSMVDEALTILSVLASCQDAKIAMVKASTIPVLIDLTRMGLPRNKENSAAILLSLCKRDSENLACISRLGAVIPLTELSRNGTERAKRKATSLLELLQGLQKTVTTGH